MSVSHQEQAVLLLTAYLGKPLKTEHKPLTPTEWGRFAQWLADHAILPEDLLRQEPTSVLADWGDRRITLERIQFLLGRAGVLGFAIEKWERAGLWVLARSDLDYPSRLKKLLKTDSPALLFGCGNRKLLNQGGIAIVGSRDASEQDLSFTSRLGGEAALQGLSIISGGARGVDEAAMLGALDQEGTAVGVLADSLLRAATSAKYRTALMANNLVLVSPFNPEAGFDVGNAMARNKYVYCLADAAILIATDKGTGGTWNGAMENLRKGWVPLWVKPHQDRSSGNFALVEQGARWLPEGALQFSALLLRSAIHQVDQPVSELFHPEAPPPADLPSTPRHTSRVSEVSIAYQSEAGAEAPKEEGARIPNGVGLYGLFLHRIEQLAATTPATPDQLLEGLEIGRSQLDGWLKRAVQEGRVKKLSKPVRYQWVFRQASQPTLFEDSDSQMIGGGA